MKQGRFPYKVQKISLNAGFTCPNRDGTKGRGGCTYCNNRTFNPDYCHAEKSITRQMEEGIRFFSRKYPDIKYLAYFQAYTNTYDTTDALRRKYEEALACPDVVGLVIGTRPDCVSDELLDYLEELSKRTFVMLEYGMESTLDRTLEAINRGHTHADSEEAVRRTHERGIPIGVHLILGLPGESRDDMLHHADVLSTMPISSLKLHQLQIIRGTAMGWEYQVHPERFHLFTVDEYIDLVVDFRKRLRSDIIIERYVSQSPKEWLLAPDWGLKNYQFEEKLRKKIVHLPIKEKKITNK